MKRCPSRLAFVASLLAAPFPAAVAGASDQVPTKTDVAGEVTVGVRSFLGGDAPTAKYEQFREVPAGLTLEAFSLSWKPPGGWWVVVEGRDAAQRDQRYLFSLGKSDRWQALLRSIENPRRFMDDAVRVYGGSGGLFTLPAALRAEIAAAPAGSPSTPGTNAALLRDFVLAAGGPLDVSYQRKLKDGGFEFTPGRRWTLRVGAEHERREGSLPQSFVGASTEAAAPIDFTTNTATAGAEYADEQLSLAVHGVVSRFSNGYPALVFDVPTSAVDADKSPSRGRVNTSPDGGFRQVGLLGSLRLPLHSRLHGSLSLGEARQDEPFLPFTINSALTPAGIDFNRDGSADQRDKPDQLSALPRSSLAGRYDTSLAQLRLASRPVEAFRVKAWWRRHGRDDQTPPFTSSGYVLQDQTTFAQSRQRLGYDFVRTNAGLEARVEVADWLEAAGGYEREGWTRHDAAVGHTGEDLYRVGVDIGPGSALLLRGSYRWRRRRAGQFDGEYFDAAYAPKGYPDVARHNPGSRPFYWSDRDRNELSVSIDWSPLSRLDLFAEGIQSRSSYFDSNTHAPIGSHYTLAQDRNRDGTDETYPILLAGRDADRKESLVLGGVVRPSPAWSLSLDYTWETSRVSLASRYRNLVAGVMSDDPADNWTSVMSDHDQTLTLAFHGEHGPTRLSGALARSRARGEVLNTPAPGGNPLGNGVDPAGVTWTVFPPVVTVLTAASVTAEHRVLSNLAAGLELSYERWSNDDWAFNQLGPYMGGDDQDPGSRLWFLLGGRYRGYRVRSLLFFIRIGV
ncbi:MAG: MtrB/PioB family outer membrane beta-barrel protein [Acidobacteria bacterium]|nr:MtrB/PioB family outer membrane beta-barrel protein [Acidobacteriota bacterium]